MRGFIVIAATLFSLAAHAQEVTLPTVAPVEEAPAPAAVITTVQQEAPRLSGFPELPPSRACVAGDMSGIWKMANLYEDPQGADTTGFTYEPHQYLRFMPDNTYAVYKSAREDAPVSELVQIMRRTDETQLLLQYVIGERGFVYFYNQGALASTMVCFVVANPRGNFTAGQMIIMPPAPTDGTPPARRLLKVYNRIAPPMPGAPAAPATPAAAPAATLPATPVIP